MTTRQRDQDLEGRPAIVVVASCSPDQFNRAEPVIRRSIAHGAPLRFLLSPGDPLLRVQLEAQGADIRVQPRGLMGVVRSRRALRREGTRMVVVLLTGERRHRRLKAAGLFLALPDGLILDEHGGFLPLTAGTLYRHLAARLAQRRSRYADLVRRARHVLGREGPGGLFRRLAARLRRQGRAKAAARLLNPLRRLRRVSIPTADRPEVSIVIPVRNQWRFTYSCLGSIARHTAGVAYEIIVVDNGSTDATRRIERSAPGVRLLRWRTNQGFIAACNAGAEMARADKIVFLNNDTTVTAGWLEALLSVARSRPSWGAVGAKLLFPNGKLQEAGGIVWRDGTAWNYGRFDDPERPEYNYVRQVDYCSAAALLVCRQAFEEAGRFDPAYAPGYWEDTDLCFALRAAGYSVWYQPAAAVFHHEGATSGIDEAKGMKRFQKLNAPRFREKWAAALQEQPEFDPASLFRARDRNRGLTVLVFDHLVPTPDRDAGSSFMHCYLKSIGDLGHRVVFWPQNLFRSYGYTDALQQQGCEVLYGALALPDYLQTCGRFIDVAIAHHPLIADEYLVRAAPFIRALGYIPSDLEHLREQRRGVAEGHDTPRAVDLKAREARLVELADCIGIHSPVEKDILERELGARNVFHLPLAVPPRAPTIRPFEERHGLLFVGSTHPPNVDAMRYFIGDVLPRIRAREPATELWVVGDVCNRLDPLEHEPGVHLVGHVPDLEPWLERARVFVSPLRYGAGIKGKILAAMSAGVPVVTTSMGAEGIGLENGSSALIEDSEGGFADAVLQLSSDQELWQRVRQRAREMADGELSFERFRAGVESMIECLAASAARPASPIDARPAREIPGAAHSLQDSL